MTAAVLQLNAQGLSSTKLYNYIRIAHKKGVKLLVLGEYILNPFFKELQHLSLEMIEESSNQQLKILKESARDYNLTIIAPLILVRHKKPYKVIVKISPKSISYYYQQFLINYPHWNEEQFFANPKESFKPPLTFKIGNIRFGVIGGFEIHFDPLWRFIEEKKIDCMIVPSISTFGSYQRWEAILKTRAFTHNCYVIRANRIGSYQEKETSWDFYGDSFLISPHGELLNHLGNEEELLLMELSHQEVTQAKKTWKFHDALLAKNLL